MKPMPQIKVPSSRLQKIDNMNIESPITDVEMLTSLFGEPHSVAVASVKDSMDEHHRRYIENTPLICIASTSEQGQPTVSPKGDAPGFVHVVDEHTLVIPDRPGNNRIQGLRNLLENPKLGVIFFIPGVRETLRIEGEAILATDQKILDLGKAGKSVPTVAIVVRVTKAYFHCGKALIRSKAWQEEGRIADGILPRFSQVLKDQTQMPAPVQEIESFVNQEYKEGLY